MSCQSESLRHGQSYYKYIHEESGRTVDPIYDKSQKFLALLRGSLKQQPRVDGDVDISMTLSSCQRIVTGAESIALQFYYSSSVEVQRF